MKKKYKAAFDRGVTAAAAGLPLDANPYSDDAPVAARYWRDGWNHKTYGPVDEVEDFDNFDG